MAQQDTATLSTYINSFIKTNGTKAITGAIMNTGLINIVDSMYNKSSDSHLVGLRPYDASKIYNTGDTVIYTNDIYQANTDAITGAWNASNWTKLVGTTGVLTYQGGYDANTNTPDLDTAPSGIVKGDMYTVTAAGTFFTTTVEVGDVIIAEVDSASAEADWTIVQNNVTYGISNGNSVLIDSATVASTEYAKFTANGLESRSFAEVKTDLSLDNVENTALSTWAGSSNITTLGTITTGVWNGTAITDSYISSAATWNAKQDALTFGIANTNALKVDDASAADNEYAKFTANGLEGRSFSEVKTDLSLNNVENTALSTWAGSANITTLGTISSGTWQGTQIADAYISSAATWNGKQDALTFGIADGNAVDIDAGASIVANDYAKFTATGLIGQTYAEVKTDLSLNNVENTAISTWAGSSNITTVGTISSGTWNGSTIGIANGGTGQTTAQAAIDALTQVSGATNEHVLTKDTATGNAVWKAASGGGSSLWTDDGGGKISYSAAASGVEVYETGFPNTYEASVTVRRGFLMVGEGHSVGHATTATTVGRSALFGGHHNIGNVGNTEWGFIAGYNNTIEEGNYNIILGNGSNIKNTSDNAISVGRLNNITGSDAITVGYSNTLSSSNAIAIGSALTAGYSSRKQILVGDNINIASSWANNGFYVGFGVNVVARPTFGLTRSTGLSDSEPLNLCMGSISAVRNDTGGARTDAGSGVFWQFLGDTAPTANPTNGVAHYTADRAAGKAGYEIKTEDGTKHFFGDFSAIGGGNADANANKTLTVVGSGTGSGTSSLLCEDSAGSSNLEVKDNGVVNMANLPTSSAGLSAGDLWNNSGVLNIV